MIQEGRFYVVFRKPDFFAESAIAYSDMNHLVEAQKLQKKFNDGLSANVAHLGGSSIDAGHFTVLDMPLGSLPSLLSIQNSMGTYVAMGVGSSLDGAYKAQQVADKYQRRVELYVPDKTEQLLKSEQENPDENVDAVFPIASDEEVNEALLAEIKAKSTQIDPQQFQGLIAEFQHILQNFKINMPAIEAMQLTNPTAYASILEVVTAASNFAQILMQSGVLSTDAAVMMEQQQQMEEQAQQAEQGGEAPPDDSGGDEAPPAADEPAKKKASHDNAIGTVKLSGKTFRIKTVDENGNPTWKYASRGLSQGPGGVAVPGTGAGSAEEGVVAPAGPTMSMDE